MHICLPIHRALLVKSSKLKCVSKFDLLFTNCSMSACECAKMTFYFESKNNLFASSVCCSFASRNLFAVKLFINAIKV